MTSSLLIALPSSLVLPDDVIARSFWSSAYVIITMLSSPFSLCIYMIFLWSSVDDVIISHTHVIIVGYPVFGAPLIRAMPSADRLPLVLETLIDTLRPKRIICFFLRKYLKRGEGNFLQKKQWFS